MNYCEEINCGYYWAEEWEVFPSCHFVGWWGAPCEENDYVSDDDYDEEEEMRMDCSTCIHFIQETADDVACCNCCDDGEFYKEEE